MAPPTPAHDTPHVAAITVSYGSAEVLSGLLDSTATASTDPLFVVVVDNKPVGVDSVEPLAREHGAAYIAQPANPGYGGAVNAGVAILPDSIEWILVVNPDVVLGPESIDALVEAAQKDDSIGSVGPLILSAEGDVYPSARSVPSLRTGVGHALFVNLWIENPWTRAYRNDTAADPVTRDAGWLSGACVLVRRTAYAAIGGFDDGYFMYFEDVDLGYRLGKAGYRNVYEPSSVVMHSGAHATKTESESARMISVHHDSARRFLNRKYSAAWMWPIRVALRVGLQLRSALVRRRSARQ